MTVAVQNNGEHQAALATVSTEGHWTCSPEWQGRVCSAMQQTAASHVIALQQHLGVYIQEARHVGAAIEWNLRRARDTFCHRNTCDIYLCPEFLCLDQACGSLE
jgi:hypothetical protein